MVKGWRVNKNWLMGLMILWSFLVGIICRLGGSFTHLVLGDYSVSSNSLKVSRCIPTTGFLPTEIQRRILLNPFENFCDQWFFPSQDYALVNFSHVQLLLPRFCCFEGTSGTAELRHLNPWNAPVGCWCREHTHTQHVHCRCEVIVLSC